MIPYIHTPTHTYIHTPDGFKDWVLQACSPNRETCHCTKRSSHHEFPPGNKGTEKWEKWVSRLWIPRKEAKWCYLSSHLLMMWRWSHHTPRWWRLPDCRKGSPQTGKSRSPWRKPQSPGLIWVIEAPATIGPMCLSYRGASLAKNIATTRPIARPKLNVVCSKAHNTKVCLDAQKESQRDTVSKCSNCA